ncbi:TLR adapter interacting with SLC15A4 on the lysosome-like [Latimeria chalumnae]|uniref:Uncharacterized protein n=1 Tax=Latimeria chalumnae TaxID=7897 RepID=H3APC0_LATCH|nr:PREDICTED: uncharacterized protein CXorf21 homolog isoform X2 [Latimeria chalumnae]|eukprot:XP_006002453.2 PREDICTED: uncharacterized protein CXorf21 homolog isoform X2 [Latimeria chalumnae]
MLGEGFLLGIGYEQDKHHRQLAPYDCQNSRKGCARQDSWENLAEDFILVDDAMSKVQVMEGKSQSAPDIKESKLENVLQYQLTQEELKKDCPRASILTKQTSDAVPVPRSYQHIEPHLDLYTSWSCKNIYWNYPDLHIGGDHVGDIDTSDVLYVTERELQNCDGPILHSVDMDPASSPPRSCLENHQAAVVANAEEVPEKGFPLPKQPLSNSILNNYMEEKIIELYKQYLEDSLSRNASPTQILTSSFVLHNVHQLSLHISQEQNMETTRAKEMVLNCLFSVVSGNSSEFSTPNLQISHIKCSTTMKKKSILKSTYVR